MIKRSLKTSVMAVALALLLACGGFNFARDFRLVLLAAPPLIEQLPLPPALKSGLVRDFTDMGGHAATLSDCLKAGVNRPADLVCVESFSVQVETVINRGNFGSANNDKIQRILSLIRGIIASAKIYYGGGTPARAGRTVTKESIEQQLKQLKAEMQVE